jgi:hypothetical protein
VDRGKRHSVDRVIRPLEKSFPSSILRPPSSVTIFTLRHSVDQGERTELRCSFDRKEDRVGMQCGQMKEDRVGTQCGQRKEDRVGTQCGAAK